MRSTSFMPTPATFVVACSITLALGPIPAAALAQQPRKVPTVSVSATAVAADVFARAQRLVAEGQGGAGRAIVDSALAASPEGSEAYAEALFWRASLASTAGAAERDYRALVVEYSMSRRAPDALMRLAQLELVRRDRAQALVHLERLVAEHPTSPIRPRASYWMARVYFEGDDAPRACAALDAARASARPTDAELRAQLDSYARRCDNVPRQLASAAVNRNSGTAAAPTSVAPTSAAPAASPPSIFSAAAPVSGAPSSLGTPTPNVAAATPATKPPAAATASTAPADTNSIFVAAAPTSAAPPPAVTPAGASATTPTPVSPQVTPPVREPSPAPLATAAPLAKPSTARVPAPSPQPPAPAFTIQLAAFDAAAPAEALVRRLRARGLDARVSGTSRPFRVRVGHYATSAEAEREATALKRRGQSAWVVRESAQ